MCFTDPTLRTTAVVIPSHTFTVAFLTFAKNPSPTMTFSGTSSETLSIIRLCDDGVIHLILSMSRPGSETQTSPWTSRVHLSAHVPTFLSLITIPLLGNRGHLLCSSSLLLLRRPSSPSGGRAYYWQMDQDSPRHSRFIIILSHTDAPLSGGRFRVNAASYPRRIAPSPGFN